MKSVSMTLGYLGRLRLLVPGFELGEGRDRQRGDDLCDEARRHHGLRAGAWMCYHLAGDPRAETSDVRLVLGRAQAGPNVRDAGRQSCSQRWKGESRRSSARSAAKWARGRLTADVALQQACRTIGTQQDVTPQRARNALASFAVCRSSGSMVSEMPNLGLLPGASTNRLGCGSRVCPW